MAEKKKTYEIFIKFTTMLKVALIILLCANAYSLILPVDDEPKDALTLLKGEDVYDPVTTSTEWIIREGNHYFFCRMMTKEFIFVDNEGNMIIRGVEEEYEVNYKNAGVEKRYIFNSLEDMNKLINTTLKRTE